MRIEISTAISGGVSDPRNSTMLKMFNFIDIGERAGSGIPNIFSVWKEQKWSDPILTEKFDPDRITLSLPLSANNTAEKKPSEKTVRKNRQKKPSDKISETRVKQIIEYMNSIEAATAQEIADAIGLSLSQTKDYLRKLVDADILVYEGKTKSRVYRIIKK